eukprot:11520146-Alexandrium_andersonii.AAC.1
MSASLVGSEMCIRDRATAASAPAASPAAAGPPSTFSCASRNSLGVKAVSYTHLTLPTICSV